MYIYFEQQYIIFQVSVKMAMSNATFIIKKQKLLLEEVVTYLFHQNKINIKRHNVMIPVLH